MEFTRTEKAAIAGILLDMVTIDGRIDSGEKSYFHQLQQNLSITNEDATEGRKMATNAKIAVIKEMTEDKKMAAAIMLQQMMEADGDIDDKEMKLFVIVCAACDLIPELEKK